MQTSGQYDIIIQMPSDTGDETVGGTPAQPREEAKPVQKDPVRGGGSGGGSVTSAAVMHLALNVGKQAVSTAIGNIGLATGNSFKQRRAQTSLTLGAKAIGYGAAIFTGNFIALAAMAAGDAINIASENYRINKEREIANYQAEQYARRIGYTNARK